VTNTGTILIADDELPQLALVSRVIEPFCYRVITARNGRDAIEALGKNNPDLVVLDVNMPLINGIEACRIIKENPATRLTPVILLTGLSEVADRVGGLDAGADDFLVKPFIVAELEARVRALMRAKRAIDQLDSAESIILSLASTIEARDPITRGHCERLAEYAAALGRHLGLDSDTTTTLYRGGFLHDIGKIGVADTIPLKGGLLTAAEHAAMQRHTTIGDTLCGEFRSLADVRPIVRHHHERLDGSGYPDRLAGDRIPLPAQIISIVDAFDAMTTDRPYRSALSSEHAFAELRREVLMGWKDASLVESFIKMMHRS
jgi:putative two-component system response regulator